MPSGTSGDADVTRDAALVRDIAESHGLRHDWIVPIQGDGSVNRVYVVDGCVVRFAIDASRPDEFAVEAWCLAQAAAHGIPSPHVLARGTLRDVPYIVQTFMPGLPGAHDPRGSWRWLAQYARAVHSIDVTHAPYELFSRFGRDLPAAWKQHLAYNAQQLSQSDPLLRLGVYSSDQQPALRAAVERLAARPMPLGLLHGDLSPRNLIVRVDGPPVLIDWGTAATGPVPHGELLPLLRAHRQTGEPTIAELTFFADELGAPLAENRTIIGDLTLLDAVDLVRWALDQRPDRLDDLARSARALLETGAAL